MDINCAKNLLNIVRFASTNEESFASEISGEEFWWKIPDDWEIVLYAIQIYPPSVTWACGAEICEEESPHLWRLKKNFIFNRCHILSVLPSYGNAYFLQEYRGNVTTITAKKKRSGTKGKWKYFRTQGLPKVMSGKQVFPSGKQISAVTHPIGKCAECFHGVWPLTEIWAGLG